MMSWMSYENLKVFIISKVEESTTNKVFNEAMISCVLISTSLFRGDEDICLDNFK